MRASRVKTLNLFSRHIRTGTGGRCLPWEPGKFILKICMINTAWLPRGYPRKF